MVNAEQQYLEYLKKTRLLVLDVNLAKAIGEKQAIILQQINFWVQHNKENETNFIDGRYWCYNSLQGWQKENFEHMTLKTVERCLEDLRNNEVVIARREVRNGKSTLFYSVDYDVMVGLLIGDRKWVKRESSKCRKDKSEENRQNVDSIRSKNELTDKMSKDKSTKCRKANGQNVEGQNDKMSKPYNIYNIYNASLTENTTEITSENTTEITRRRKEDANASMSFGQEGAAPYIVLPDTAESKPCIPSRERTYALNSMFDNCRMKVLRDFGHRESDAKWVSEIVEHFCTEYRKNTEKMHGIIKGKQLTDIIQFILNELKNGANIVEDMDNYLQNASQNKLNYQLSDYVNERMAA